MKFSRIASLGCWLILACPLVPDLLAQRREDILSIQRDVAQLQDQIKQLQASQDQKMASLESMLKQALEVFKCGFQQVYGLDSRQVGEDVRRRGRARNEASESISSR